MPTCYALHEFHRKYSEYTTRNGTSPEYVVMNRSTVRKIMVELGIDFITGEIRKLYGVNVVVTEGVRDGIFVTG